LIKLQAEESAGICELIADCLHSILRRKYKNFGRGFCAKVFFENKNSASFARKISQIFTGKTTGIIKAVLPGGILLSC